MYTVRFVYITSKAYMGIYTLYSHLAGRLFKAGEWPISNDESVFNYQHIKWVRELRIRLCKNFNRKSFFFFVYVQISKKSCHCLRCLCYLVCISRGSCRIEDYNLSKRNSLLVMFGRTIFILYDWMVMCLPIFISIVLSDCVIDVLWVRSKMRRYSCNSSIQKAFVVLKLSPNICVYFTNIDHTAWFLLKWRYSKQQMVLQSKSPET